jgi:hypothetical protein
MSSLFGNLRNTIIAAAVLGALAPHFVLAAGPLRSGGGLQRVIGPRRSSQGGGSDKKIAPGSGSFINRNFPGNGPVKRVLGGNSPAQPKYSKSEILTKYGAGTNGTWSSLGQKATATAAKPAEPGAKTANAAEPTQPLDAQPPVAAAVAAQGAGTAPAGSADLVLEDVTFIEPATETAGPAYRLKLRNQGTQAAGKFRIGAFAERNGLLSDDAPHVVSEVASLAAGAVSELTLRLPLSALRLVSTSAAEPVAFDQLLVVVDLDDAVVESEKSNNVASLKRSELEAAEK